MPLRDLAGDRGLRTVPGLGSEAVGRDRCRAPLALDNLAHLIPHKCEGPPKAMKRSQETPPLLAPSWSACMVSAQRPLGSDTCPGHGGVSMLCSGCSGSWHERRALGFLPSLVHPLFSGDHRQPQTCASALYTSPSWIPRAHGDKDMICHPVPSQAMTSHNINLAFTIRSCHMNDIV